MREDNVIHFTGANEPESPAALWDATPDILTSIEFERRMIRVVWDKPEVYRGSRQYSTRIYCATLRRLRRALRERAVVAIPAWAGWLASGERNDVYSLPDAQLISRLRWLEEIAADVGCIYLDILRAARDQIQIEMGRRWLRDREERGQRLAQANRKRAEQRRWRTAS